MNKKQPDNLGYSIAYQKLCKVLYSLNCMAELLERQDNNYFEYSQSGRLGLACLLRLSAKMEDEAIRSLPLPSKLKEA